MSETARHGARSGGRRIVLAVGALLLALAFGWAWRAGYVPGSAAPEKKREDGRGFEGPVSVSVAQAREIDFPITADAVGTVQALNTVTIRTQVDGRLLRLAFTEGQEVKKGDLIAEIDPALYQAQYDQAVAKKAQDEANLANARVDLSRYQRLVAGQFASKQQYATQKALVSQLEAQVRADQAAINNTKATLDYATIRSPIDGRAGIRLVDVGNILRAGDQTGIVVITQLKPIYVVFTLPQQTLPAIRKAQAAGRAQVNALGPDNVSVLETGELTVIDNQIDQLTGTVKCKATFANTRDTLWPGQFVNVRMTLDMLKNAVAVPSQAVQRGPAGAFVYVLQKDDKVAMRPVSTGAQDERNAVVTSGLHADETVVTSGFTRLSDGAKVRVITSNAAPGRQDEGKGAGAKGDAAERQGRAKAGDSPSQ